MINTGILKKASEDLNNFNNVKVVKVAGVVRQLVNWFKQLSNDEYREHVKNLRNDSVKVKTLMDHLEEEIRRLQSAIKDADVEDYNQALEEVKYLSKQLVNELDSLQQDAGAAEVATSQDTVVEQNQIQTGRDVNRSFSSFSEFSNLPFHFSEAVKGNLLAKVQQSTDLDMSQFDAGSFFVLFEEAVKNGTVSKVSPVQKEGRTGQMYLTIRTAPFSVPNVPYKFIVNALFVYIPGSKISMYKTNKVFADKISTASDRKEMLTKIAQLQNLDQWARAVLVKAFKEEMGRMPTYGEIQTAQSVAWLETNYGRGWKGAGKNSNNWGAIQSGLPKGGACDVNSFLYTDSNPQPDGSNKRYSVCFRKYPTPVAGAKDLIRQLFKSKWKSRGKKLLEAANYGTLRDISSVLYDTTYYGGFGKNRDERISNHVKAMENGLNRFTKALNEKDYLREPPEKDKKAPGDNGEYNAEVGSLMDYLYNAAENKSSLSGIVKRALEKKLLPSTKLVLRVNSNSMPNKVKFALATANVLESLMDADVSIHGEGGIVEISCSVVGDKMVVVNAVNEVVDYISNRFNFKFNKTAGASCKLGASIFENIPDKTIVRNERKFHLEVA